MTNDYCNWDVHSIKVIKMKSLQKEQSDPVCISSGCATGQICFTVSFRWQMVWQLIELINCFQLFNHCAIILLYFYSPNLKQIQPFVEMVSWTCNASQQAGLYPSDCLSVPESWGRQRAYITSHIGHGRIRVSPREYDNNNINNNNIIISDGSIWSPFLKGKDTSLPRGASKIKTRSVTVTWGFVNWEWQCQISPNTSK